MENSSAALHRGSSPRAQRFEQYFKLCFNFRLERERTVAPRCWRAIWCVGNLCRAARMCRVSAVDYGPYAKIYGAIAADPGVD